MLTFEVFVGQVEQQDKDNTAVVSINDSSTGVNHELGCLTNALAHLFRVFEDVYDIPRPLLGATRP